MNTLHFFSLTQARASRDRLAMSVLSALDADSIFPAMLERVCCAGEGWRADAAKIRGQLRSVNEPEMNKLCETVEWIHAEERRQVRQSIPQPKPEAGQ